MAYEIIPLNEDLFVQMGTLLAERQQRDRSLSPFLPERFENSQIAVTALQAALARPMTQGFAAVDGERLLAYLVGEMILDATWGRSGWVRMPGCAYAQDCSPEVVRDLYAALGQQWIDYGVFSHFALIPVFDPDLLQAWYSLSFGIQQVHALLDLRTIEIPKLVLPDGIEIRRARPGDEEILSDLSDLIWRHQVGAPVWGIQLPEVEGEMREGWAELASDPSWMVWLAFEDGKAIAMQGYRPTETSQMDLMIPEKCCQLTVAGTRPAARGRGIGVALTLHGLHKAREAGNHYCETDWRSTNLLSSRFWPRRGFHAIYYRLARRIDSRIAWAHGGRS
jgi:GNAT superfamily N-acetyltransferase